MNNNPSLEEEIVRILNKRHKHCRNKSENQRKNHNVPNTLDDPRVPDPLMQRKNPLQVHRLQPRLEVVVTGLKTPVRQRRVVHELFRLRFDERLGEDDVRPGGRGERRERAVHELSWPLFVEEWDKRADGYS